MRTIFFVLIFQLIAPAFLPIAQSYDNEHEKLTTVQTQHSSILLPLLEKEETEHEDNLSHFTFAQLIIDFTDHSLVLAGLHEIRYHFLIRHDHQPQLFNLFCTFII